MAGSTVTTCFANATVAGTWSQCRATGVRSGSGSRGWEHSEKLKGLITEEHRVINPKFGRQSVEYNACRWVLLSNHLSARR